MGAEAICQITAVTSMILLQRHPTGGFWESTFAVRMQGDCPLRAGNVDNRSGEAALRHAERVESRQKAASALIAPASAECVARWLYAVNFPNYPDLRL